VFYTKNFAKKFVAIFCKFFFTTKFVSISYKKKFKTKLTGNMSFFSSDWEEVNSRETFSAMLHFLFCQ